MVMVKFGIAKPVASGKQQAANISQKVKTQIFICHEYINIYTFIRVT